MSVSYSTIKAVSEPEAMAALLTEQVFGSVLPSVQVIKVRTKQGRRFEAPRVLWNVYEAELVMSGGVEAHPLFWTKALFNDEDCQHYRSRIDRLLATKTAIGSIPNGYARYFQDLNLFLFFFPMDPVFPSCLKWQSPLVLSRS